MTNDTYSGNKHIYVGIEHISTHLIGFHGNIQRWGTSHFGILISSFFFGVLQHSLVKVTVTNDIYSGKEHINLGTKHILTPLIGFHGNIPRRGTSQLGISLI